MMRIAFIHLIAILCLAPLFADEVEGGIADHLDRLQNEAMTTLWDAISIDAAKRRTATQAVEVYLNNCSNLLTLIDQHVTRKDALKAAQVSRGFDEITQEIELRRTTLMTLTLLRVQARPGEMIPGDLPESLRHQFSSLTDLSLPEAQQNQYHKMVSARVKALWAVEMEELRRLESLEAIFLDAAEKEHALLKNLALKSKGIAESRTLVERHQKNAEELQIHLRSLLPTSNK